MPEIPHPYLAEKPKSEQREALATDYGILLRQVNSAPRAAINEFYRMTGCGINWEKGKPERLTKDEMKPLLDEIEKMRKKNNIDAYNFTSNNRLYK